MDSLSGRDNVNIVKVGNNRFALLRIKSSCERVALLASVSLPNLVMNLVCVALSVLPDVCAVGGMEM